MTSESVLKSLFGDKGLTGGVLDVLKSTGVLKDPEMALKVEESLRNYEVNMKGKEVDLERVHADDRRSAREREIAVKDKTPTVLAFFSFVGFFVILLLLMQIDLPDRAHDPVMIMLGLLGGMVTAVINYYYGSSSGSAAKTAAMGKIMGRKGD